MSGTLRSTLAAALGFGMGMGIGPISMFAIHARYMLRSGADWPEWSSTYLLALLVTSVPAGINGAIGAGLAARRGSRDRAPVTIFPVALHGMVGLATLVADPPSFLGFQWYTLVFTVVIWSAGRLGQRIGCALSPAGPPDKEPRDWQPGIGSGPLR